MAVQWTDFVQRSGGLELLFFPFKDLKGGRPETKEKELNVTLRRFRRRQDGWGLLHRQQTHANAERTGYFPDEAEDYAPDVSLQGRIPRRYALQFFWPSTAPCKSPRARFRRTALSAG
jgi:hypothetical protein